MIKNLGRFAHPPGGGRDTNKGRHNAGSNPAPGSGTRPPNKGSQAEPAGNKVKTGSPGQMTPKSPMTDASNQSLQAQSQLSAPPAPFKTTQGIVGMGAPAVMPYGSTFKHTSGLNRSAAPKNPSAGPVGGMKPKTLSHMVGVKNNPPRIKGAINKSAKKGGHSLLYGD